MVSFKEYLLMESDEVENIKDYLNRNKKSIKAFFEKCYSDAENNGAQDIQTYIANQVVSLDENDKDLKNAIIILGIAKPKKKDVATFLDIEQTMLPYGKKIISNSIKNLIKALKDADIKLNIEDGISPDELKGIINFLDGYDPFDDPSDEEDEEDEKDEEESLDGGNGDNGGKNEGPKNDNTQVSSSNTSSSFSSDDWEILFKEKNDRKIEDILNKVANNIIAKMKKKLEDRTNQVVKDKELMGEEDNTQEELWSVINERVNLGRGTYWIHDKDKSVNMYKDGSVSAGNAGNANSTFEHYKNEIDQMTKNIAGRIAEINGKRSFNSSDGKLNRIRNQVRSIVLDYHNELLDIENEFSKKISKVGLLQKHKINKVRQKERDDAYFNSSEQGEMYNSALNEKTSQVYNAFNSILKRSQVKTFDDMIAKQLATLAVACGNAKDFKNACASKIVLTENGGTMNALDYLINKGIKIPSFKGTEHKQSGLNYKAYADAFNKFKIELKEENKYNQEEAIKRLTDAINDNKEIPSDLASLTAEIALIRKALKREEPQGKSQNTDTQNNNAEALKDFNDFLKKNAALEEVIKKVATLEQNNVSRDALKKHFEKIKYNIPNDFWEKVDLQKEQTSMAVTTAKCDGLPIGARRYSRAIRRRMNYALNKYM